MSEKIIKIRKATQKQTGFLQLSCMELKAGQIIPTSDRQYNTTDGGFSEFFRDLPRSVDVNFLEQ